MNNISFANPWLLFLMIPLIAVFVIPFFFSVKKSGFSWHNLTSLGIHVAIAILLSFAASDISVTQAEKNTQVYVLADVSESMKDSFDTIDSTISQLNKQCQNTAQLGVVCFGRDQEVLVRPGSLLRKVEHSKVDDSATDIAAALTYTASLFDEEVNKKIVLISDAKETDDSALSVIDSLKSQNIELNCFYVSHELTDQEVEIVSVENDESTLVNKSKKAKVTLQSNSQQNVSVTLYEENEKLSSQSLITASGIDVLSFDLDTSRIGSHSYSFKITPSYDSVKENNTYYFSQEVVSSPKVLIIAGSEAEKKAATTLYQGYDATAVLDTGSISSSLDYLCQYDEIVLANADLTKINSASSFLASLTATVTDYGKTLNVLGNNTLYPKGGIYDSFYSMMPANFDISSSSTALVLVIDASMTMQQNNRMGMAKQGAIQCLDLLDEDDYVSVISFSTNTKVVVPLTRLYDKDEIIKKINSITNSQGTNMAAALNAAYDQIAGMEFDSKQVLLLSDGVPTDYGQVAAAQKLLADGATTSVINITSSEGASLMQQIAAAGNGNYYYISNASDIPSIMLKEVDSSVSSSLIEQTCTPLIQKENDVMTTSITSLPNVNGFVYANSKYSATTCLTTKFINDNSVTKEAPLFAYWNYGKGKVSLFTSDIGSDWASSWLSDESSLSLFQHLLSWSVPQYHSATPFHIISLTNGYTHTLQMSFDSMSRNLQFTQVRVTTPAGKTINCEFTLADGTYQTTFETTKTGKYELSVSYQTDNQTYSFHYYFSHSYSSEYNSFRSNDSSLLYNLTSDNGKVLDKITDFEAKDSTYHSESFSISLILLIVALVLFVIDLAIRKLKKADLIYFFSNMKNGKKAKTNQKK